MAPLRFICFLLVLVLVYVRDSTAQTHQDMKKSVAAHGRELEAAGRSSTNVEKDDGVPGVAVLGGRKRMLKRGLAKEEVLNREDSISGAAHSVGNCNRRRKGILNVECKLRKRGPQPHHKKVKMGGFTAFSADYHVPKSHPPRNN
ncbi:uncharacterized protein LOC116146317 [Pistacia vera]|uniref:uncharacterized protein LOC116146317 n=1 Tax=Pistacia vera TaxID=55513 RepID=UPI001263525F|nr:uncharacterized protein LOC116146317 [Pistacia vera]